MADYDIVPYSDGDTDTNRSNNPDIQSIISERYSRRGALKSVAGIGAVALPGFALVGCEDDQDNAAENAIVLAGNSVTTSAGRPVNLAANVSSGTPVSFSWAQISGPTVTLTGATTATPSFTAPGVTASTAFEFIVTATNSSGNTFTGRSTVTVTPGALSIAAVAKNRDDVVTVPTGYTVTVLYRGGDPINAATADYANDGTNTNYNARAGDHHDGMYYFGLAATGTAPDLTNSTRGLLCINHENITEVYLHPNGPTLVGGARPEAEALKEMENHGVSVIEVTRAGATGAWTYNRTSAFNRRITPLTEMDINGPVRANALVQTAFSPTGVAGRGTINNCANGFTPWGTYITAEENWAGYFRRRPTDAANRSTKEITALTRYSVGGGPLGGGANSWFSVIPADPNNTIYLRWTAEVSGASAAADFRNEANQFGYSVEIDPYTATSRPRKRTAMGRMAKEGAWPGRFISGVRPAWYMGDDSAGDYMYKFVSTKAWVPADAQRADRLTVGDEYLDFGILYVARFNADGTGQWLPLVFGQGPLTNGNAVYPFADQADVLVHARLAGDALGATRMDRPEWTAVNPANGEVYLTLTQGPTRTGVQGTPNPVTQVPSSLATDQANPRVYVDPPSTARTNRNGHIIRLREAGNTTEALTFTWDIYLFAAGQDLDPVNINISGLTNDNDLSAPDGLWFSRSQNAGGVGNPLLWIQTDDSAYLDVTNCMMLVAQVGTVGDGGTRTITNTLASGATVQQATRVGAQPGTNLRRFLVGPKGAEITGIDSTPDGRTVFVNIQHPGETSAQTLPSPLPSNWPATQGGTVNTAARPRSATIVITKNDGGVVGL